MKFPYPVTGNLIGTEKFIYLQIKMNIYLCRRMNEARLVLIKPYNSYIYTKKTKKIFYRFYLFFHKKCFVFTIV